MRSEMQHKGIKKLFVNKYENFLLIAFNWDFKISNDDVM